MESEDNIDAYIKDGEKCYRVEFGHTLRSKDGGHIIFDTMTEHCYFEYISEGNYEFEELEEDPFDYDDTYALMFLHAQCFESIKWGKYEKQKEPIYCSTCDTKMIGMHNIAVGETPDVMARITPGYVDLDDKGEPLFTEIVQADLIPDRYMCLQCMYEMFSCPATIMETLEATDQMYKQESDEHEKDKDDYVEQEDRWQNQ
jgi:hypothetical protein